MIHYIELPGCLNDLKDDLNEGSLNYKSYFNGIELGIEGNEETQRVVRVKVFHDRIVSSTYYYFYKHTLK